MSKRKESLSVLVAEHMQLDALGSATPPADLFDRASREIFTLMERDTHERFKEDADAERALVDDFFKNADTVRARPSARAPCATPAPCAAGSLVRRRACVPAAVSGPGG